jgi:metal-responsive CopG/Arc/MetJ family transcriptional regulator
MALSARKRTTTIILDAELDRLLDRAARERGVSRSEFIRAQLRRVLEQYRSHPRPKSAGVIRGPLGEAADEERLYRELER